MKTPIDVIKGTIVDWDERTQELTIKAHYDDINTMLRREYKDVSIQLHDSLPLSQEQRKMCYSLLNAIAEWAGNGRDETKQIMKYEFLIQHLEFVSEELFSLSNAPMSLVCCFQSFLVDFIISNGIPTKRPLIEYVDDIEQYVYSCMIHKQCCVCGKPAELHHWDKIGMGRDRNEVDQVGMKAMPLCRTHHTECHTIGQKEFDRAYYLSPVEIDKTILKIYGIKKGQKNNVKSN